MDRLTSRIFQQRKIPVTNGSSAPNIYVSKAGHSSLRHVRAEFKDKKPDVPDFHRNIEYDVISNSIDCM